MTPLPLPNRRPLLGALTVLGALLVGVDAALSLSRFVRDVADGARYIYPALGPPMEVGVCCVLLMNGALCFFPRLRAVRQGWLYALAGVSLGLVYGVGPAVGGVWLTRTLRAHGYSECRPMGWIDHGLWVFPGHACR